MDIAIVPWRAFLDALQEQQSASPTLVAPLDVHQ